MGKRNVNFDIWWPERPDSWGVLRRYLIPHPGTLIITLLLVGGLLWAGSVGAIPLHVPAAAGTSSTIAYQGRLADSAGTPITDTVNMEFRLYDVAEGGAPLWDEMWTGANAVRVSDGLFNVMLGSLNAIPQSVIAGHDQLWLGITVGTDDEMTPRVQLGSVPFAVQALTVPSLPKLLGYKTCSKCGTPTESNLSLWNPVKGADDQDIIEVSVTTRGRPVMVHMTTRYTISPAGDHWCGIAVFQGDSQIRFAHLDGDTSVDSSDWGCSGTYVFADLPAGAYTFRAMAWVHPAATVRWVQQRQIAVYEF